MKFQELLSEKGTLLLLLLVLLVLFSQSTTFRLALFSIPFISPLWPTEPPSAIASTSTTSEKGQCHWIFLKTLTKNHFNSTITVASISTSITAIKNKVIYKQKRLACFATYKKVVKDIKHIQRYSLNTSFYNR